jgi:hypothetical protein
MEPENPIIIYQTQDGQTQIDVKLKDEQHFLIEMRKPSASISTMYFERAS